jgi:hypothetical protein
MEIEKNAFPITVLQWPRQEAGSKNDRVMRLEPDCRNGRFILPAVLKAESPAQLQMRQQGQAFRIFTPQKRIDENGNVYSVNRAFLDEYLYFPFSQKKDFIDATSRVYDMDSVPPIIYDQQAFEPEVFADGI